MRSTSSGRTASIRSTSWAPTWRTRSTRRRCPRTSANSPWWSCGASTTTSGRSSSAPRPRPQRGAGSQHG
eukprot:12799057-Alexandrium_andersonii.AAC.1